MFKSLKYIILFGAATVLATPAFSANIEPKEAVPVAVPAEKTKSAHKAGSSASYLSSQFARQSGDIDSALGYLQSMHSADPTNGEISSQYMGMLLFKGQVDAAMKVASSIPKDSEQAPMAALMQSLQEIKNKNYDKASKILDEAFANEGGQLWLPLVSAWLDVQSGKLQKPLMMEELSAEVGRAAPIVNYHLALINAQAGFTEAAAENFRQSIEDPENPPARVMQMLLQFYDKNNSPVSLKGIVENYRRVNPDLQFTAEDSTVGNVQDGVAEVLFTMGTIMLSAEANQDATLYLQLALYLKPNMHVAMLTLAEVYSDLKQYGVATELLTKIPADSKYYSVAQLHMAMNLGRMNKWNDALAQLDSIIKQSPTNIEAYVAKGDLLRIHEQFGDAVAAYSAALDQVREVSAKHWVIYFARGTCLERMGQWADAESNLRRALELKPGQPDTANYLGFSMLTRGQNVQEAKTLIEKALEVRPNDPQIIDSMGWALYLTGDYEKAAEYMEKAVAALPADAVVNDHLGDVYWRLGRKTEARFQWERALTYSQDTVLSESIQRKLKDGLPPSSLVAAPQAQKTAQAPSPVIVPE